MNPWKAAVQQDVSGDFAVSAAYVAGSEMAKKIPTVEELQSELEKWRGQAELAQRTILHLSGCLAKSEQACADLEEEVRLEDLRVQQKKRDALATIRQLDKRVATAEKEVEELKNKNPTPSTAPTFFAGQLVVTVGGKKMEGRVARVEPGRFWVQYDGAVEVGPLPDNGTGIRAVTVEDLFAQRTQLWALLNDIDQSLDVCDEVTLRNEIYKIQKQRFEIYDPSSGAPKKTAGPGCRHVWEDDGEGHVACALCGTKQASPKEGG